MTLLSQDSDNLQSEVLPDLSAETVFVTVSMAEDWLATMIKDQRNPSSATVKKYAEEMARGTWTLSAPLAFDSENRLIDGQHRLLALIKSGVPTPFLVIRNLPTSAALKFDIGKNRTAQNIAHLKGHPWIGLRHISTFLAMLESPTTSATIPLLSHEDKIEGVIKHKEAIEFALSKVHGSWQNACLLSVVARAYYTQNHKRLEEFLEVLTTGVCRTDEDSAAIALRESWLKRTRSRSGKGGRISLVRLTTNALKNFIQKNKIKSLKETTINHFPVQDCDLWWQSKNQEAA